MSFNPLISVVIPTFNRRTFLERAIESVEKQVYKNFEIIVVDDGSTDETSSFLKLSQHKSIHLTQNSGVSYARNKGVESAQGDYICFLDSDDYWLPHKLQLQTELINKDKLRWGHGEEIWVRNGVRVNQKLKHKKGGGDQFIPSLSLCLISPSTVMIEKELFLEHGGFGEKFTVCEDYDLWLRLLIDNPVSFVDTPVIEKHAGHADQLSYKYFAMDKYLSLIHI